MIETRLEDNKIIIVIPDEYFNLLESDDTIPLRIIDINKMLNWIKNEMFLTAYASGESWLEGIVINFENE